MSIIYKYLVLRNVNIEAFKNDLLMFLQFDHAQQNKIFSEAYHWGGLLKGEQTSEFLKELVSELKTSTEPEELNQLFKLHGVISRVLLKTLIPDDEIPNEIELFIKKLGYDEITRDALIEILLNLFKNPTYKEFANDFLVSESQNFNYQFESINSSLTFQIDWDRSYEIGVPLKYFEPKITALRPIANIELRLRKEKEENIISFSVTREKVEEISEYFQAILKNFNALIREDKKAD